MEAITMRALPRDISRDGHLIAFTSNWGVEGGRKDVFILKILNSGNVIRRPFSPVLLIHGDDGRDKIVKPLRVFR